MRTVADHDDNLSEGGRTFSDPDLRLTRCFSCYSQAKWMFTCPNCQTFGRFALCVNCVGKFRCPRCRHLSVTADVLAVSDDDSESSRSISTCEQPAENATGSDSYGAPTIKDQVYALVRQHCADLEPHVTSWVSRYKDPSLLLASLSREYRSCSAFAASGPSHSPRAVGLLSDSSVSEDEASLSASNGSPLTNGTRSDCNDLQLNVGSRVRVIGLKYGWARAFNRKFGTVLKIEAEAGRCLVRIDGHELHQSFKLSNLDPCSSIDNSRGRGSHDEGFKLKLCTFWKLNGQHCKHGQDCTFAHGESELEPLRTWRHQRKGFGSQLQIMPTDIGFCRDVVAFTFRDGTPILSTVFDLVYKRIELRDIEEMQVVLFRDSFYSISNRQLCLYRLCEHLGLITHETHVKVRLLERVPPSFARKFTTCCAGAWVRVCNDGRICGRTLQETSFGRQELLATGDWHSGHKTCTLQVNRS